MTRFVCLRGFDFEMGRTALPTTLSDETGESPKTELSSLTSIGEKGREIDVITVSLFLESVSEKDKCIIHAKSQESARKINVNISFLKTIIVLDTRENDMLYFDN